MKTVEICCSKTCVNFGRCYGCFFFFFCVSKCFCLYLSEMASKRKAGESLSPLTGQSKVSRQSSSGKAAKEEGSIQDLLQRMCDRQERQFDALTAQLADVQQQQSALRTSFTQLEENCKLAIATSEEAKKRVEDLTTKFTRLESRFESISNQHADTIVQLRSDIVHETADRISREANVIVFGLEEIKGSSEAREDHLLKEKIVDFSRETLQVGLSGSDIAETRRLGKKKAAIGDAEEAGRTPRTPCPVFVKFTSTKVRNEFTSGRTRLKGKSIFINDDLTPAEQARRRTLVPIFKSLKKNKKIAAANYPAIACSSMARSRVRLRSMLCVHSSTVLRVSQRAPHKLALWHLRHSLRPQLSHRRPRGSRRGALHVT